MTDLETRLRAMLTPNADGLLPCPWCGDKSPSLEHCVLGVSVVCADCVASGPLEKQIVKAIAAWNRRPLVRALVEAMRQSSHGYRYVWDVLSDRHKAEIGQWFERDDAKILAILDGKEGT